MQPAEHNKFIPISPAGIYDNIGDAIFPLNDTRFVILDISVIILFDSDNTSDCILLILVDNDIISFPTAIDFCSNVSILPIIY